MSGALFNDDVQDLITLIEESTRASSLTSQYFVEPAPGVLSRAKSRRHHILFGRRGSGKSSLLNKIHSENLIQRTPSAFVDLEKFKGHIYPDVLLSILIETFTAYEAWLKEAAIAPASKKSFWSKIAQIGPTKRKAEKAKAKELSEELRVEIDTLNQLLQQEERISVEDTAHNEAENSDEVQMGANLNGGGGSLEASASAGRRSLTSREKRKSYETQKHQILQRNILRYQSLFAKIKSVSASEVFLIFDDLYHIIRLDQADVIDYFHKIAKGGSFWLKIGTVRHRTSHYRNGNPPVGVKLSDDIDAIDLDLTLEKYATTKKFLFEVLSGYANTHDVQIASILTDGARDRLVLASGGVARDFLSLFRNSIYEARERLNSGDVARGEKVTAEDVNRASGQYYNDKLQELERDTAENDQHQIESEIENLRSFCFEKSNSNIVLIRKDANTELRNVIGELVDLKIIHQVRSGVSIRTEPGVRYDAFMLDYSFYTGDRTKRGFEIIDFWKSKTRDDEIRKKRFVYVPKET
ncbi:hypothetical protein [Hyphococcus luteus]|uniref:hypothetical protein n=1 Tax=Hyphococcus luteus TaxID=2058213 RepID=UPI0010570FA8|nr:hypothetical protein [Marinicaulis flavus]